jgi:hypothetical protein
MVVVDGYNLIGGEAGVLSGLSLEKERNGLIRRLEQLSAVTGGRFLVVFDGSVRGENSSAGKTSEAASSVSIAFSKSGQTADNWILKYLSRRPKQSAILVTRDRELAQKAKKLGFKVETDLGRLEVRVEPYLAQPVAPSSAGGGLFSSLSRQSREALARARKKAKKQ